MKIQGKCLCGAVSFTAEAEAGLHVCHCSMCRRWAGGPSFSTEASGVQFKGEENLQRYNSSEWGERGFCKQCGSSLFYRLKEPDQYILNMGAVDDQSLFTIASEIFVDEKPPGYDLVGTHPRLTGEEFLASLQND